MMLHLRSVSLTLVGCLATAGLVACTGTTAAPRTLAAVTTPIATGPVGPPRTFRGILTDSLLTNDLLRGALVSIDTLARVTATSTDGGFTFDSVTPGTHRLIVRHPLLDSLGLDTLSIPFRTTADSAPILVALPQPHAFISARCSDRRDHVGDGLVIGVVRDARTDQPVADVDVIAAWRGGDSTFAGSGQRERARVRTTALGQFTICHAPRFSAIELWARHKTRETPRVRLELGAAEFGAYDLTIDHAAGTDSSAPLPAGRITGRILTQTGDGLPNVQLTLDRPGDTTLTDLDGRFAFLGVPPGLRTLNLRAIGFRPTSVGLNLRPAQLLERDITLNRTVAVLGGVVVRANYSAGWDSTGFERRRRNGGGYFFSRESLSGIADLATALRLVPGIRGRTSERSQRLIAGRGTGCYPAFIVNGVRFEGGGNIGPESMIRASDVRAIEAYTSRLSTPPEHQRFADCAVIVIWLRDPQREREADGASKPKKGDE
jgi:hypothetical protein